jgi:hypothetical protein
MTDQKHEGIRSGVRSGHITSLDSNESGRPFSSSGAGQLRPVTGVPSTIAGVTDEKLDGYATVHIVLGLGGEHAAAEPASRDRASHRRFFFSVSVHAFSLRPTEGQSPIRKDPRGDFIGEGAHWRHGGRTMRGLLSGSRSRNSQKERRADLFKRAG